MARYRICGISSVEQLAVPVSCLIILFLAYTSQYLFSYIEPGPLSRRHAIWFNGFILAVWWCYDRAVNTDPGAAGWTQRLAVDDVAGDDEDDEPLTRLRWCKKCEAVKPPRAHHCRQCRRYALKIREYGTQARLILACPDASPRWTTIAPGPRIVFLTRPFHTSSASSSTLWSACSCSPTILSNGYRSSGQTEIFPRIWGLLAGLLPTSSSFSSSTASPCSL